MGGRGASSGSSIKTLTQKENSLRERMTKLYNENSGFARTDIKSVSEAREKWYKLKKEVDKIREKRESLQKPSEQTRQGQKTFVNSYGEATKSFRKKNKKKFRNIIKGANKWVAEVLVQE